MSAIPFSALPDDARVWVFASPEPVEGDAAERLLHAAAEFVARWAAHGARVVGAADWRYDHFLLVGADEAATGVSGCSIDSLFHALKGLQRELGVTLIDSSRVWYRGADGGVRSASRPEFRALVEGGVVGGDMIVFDNTVQTTGQVFRGEWERPFAGSWQERAFSASRVPGAAPRS